MGAGVRQHLESLGHDVFGIDLPGKGAEVDADLSSAQGREAAVAAVVDHCGGRLDAVFANAGVDIDNPAIVLGVNYFGVVDLLQGLQPVLAASAPTAVVVNASNSVAITPGIPLAPVDALLEGDEDRALAQLEGQENRAYAVSKLAVSRWLRRHAAADSWAGSGIRLNGICPGPVRTPLLEHDLEDPVKGPAIRGLPCPLGEFTTIEHVAYLVDFLLSERAKFIIGQLIMIDGGIETTFRADDHPSAWAR
jgi:NAD(P)-dependent dehydrogenase (short-subunit alcohol dehydrogenase family)